MDPLRSTAAVTYVAQPAAARPISSRVGEAGRSRAGLLACCLFVVGALIAGFTIWRDIDPFDEGIALQAARRILDGQVPYRDFLWAYGPAQPYVLAGLFKLFGVSLVQWRVLWALSVAGVALVAYALVRDVAGSLPLALLAWLTVVCEMAEPRTANPVGLALLFAILALWVASRGTVDRRRVVVSAVLIAVAAAFRLDFAIYGLAAVVVTLVLRREWRRAVACCAIAVGLVVLVYLPFAISDGPSSLYQALIGNSLRTRDYWTLPFPISYHAPAAAGVGKTLKHGLDFYVPLLVVISFAVCVAGAALTWWRDRRPPPLACGLLVLGLGTLAYLLSRTDDYHTQPLLVVAVVGLLVLASRSPRVVAGACVMLVLLLLAHGAGNRLSALLHPPTESTIHVPVADGVTAPPAQARAIERMVALVDANVPPGQPIYVLPRRSDLVRVGDPLIYVLTERNNPSSEDFGLQTGAAAQAQIVSMLARVRPRVLVRWTDPTSSQPEPNLRGRSSGVHTVDDWVAAHYRVLARLYHYDVLIAAPPNVASPEARRRPRAAAARA